MKTETLRYQSSVDGTKPLIVDVCFKLSRKKLPLIVVMHGYSGGREARRSIVPRAASIATRSGRKLWAGRRDRFPTSTRRAKPQPPQATTGRRGSTFFGTKRRRVVPVSWMRNSFPQVARRDAATAFRI